jgi:ABC-type polysaccharide/polyol phosphate transport system ATPase subunit
MKDVTIRFDGVSKRFRRGERHDSLRDLLPSLARRLLGRPPKVELAARDFLALDNISLTVRQGETLGVIGHNGAGKSTMLKHFAGIMTPTNGVVEVRGRLSALIEIGAGFHPDLTGRENVFLSGVILGMSRAEVTRKFDAIVEFAGLGPFIDTPVKRYSTGMFARLGFAVAAHLEPDILVIDEVLSVGDFVFQQKSLRKMRDIAASGATVVFVSHNLKAVSELCRRAILLDGGRIVADGPTDEVIQTYLRGERQKLNALRDVDVEITDVRMTRDGDEIVHFRSGDEVTVTVDFRALRRTERIAVVLAVLDEGLATVFYTSTDALPDSPPVDLDVEETCTIAFGLQLHLATGTFHVGVWLHRTDIDREFDESVPAATFFVASSPEVRGAANLWPTVRSTSIGRRAHLAPCTALTEASSG